MNKAVKNVYIAMLSKYIDPEPAHRISEARWALIDLGAPLYLELKLKRYNDFKEWTEWMKE